MATKYDGANLSLTFDGTEINADGTSVVLDNEDADTDSQTFAEVAAGNTSQWFFQITALGDYAAGSLWDLLWQNSGQTIPYVFKPYGNTAASTTQPHFTGNAKVIAKPPIGGGAGSTWTFEARLDCDDVPALVTV